MSEHSKIAHGNDDSGSKPEGCECKAVALPRAEAERRGCKHGGDSCRLCEKGKIETNRYTI